MKLGYRQLKAGHAPLGQTLSAARGARNRKSRDARAQEQEDYARQRRHRRRRAKEERELRRALNRRFKVQVPEKERPRIANACPRKLFHRLTGLAFGSTGMTPIDDGGVRTAHFAFVARGFASKTGRRWRSGEGGRAALYVTRAEGLEGGEAGWWSNIAEDRNELVAYSRVSEEVEKHDRANANVYISEIIALDHTLTARQRRRVVRRICRYFEKRGLGYVTALHMPDPSGDQRNFHCHILYSLRPVRRVAAYEWEFAVSKVPDINTPAGIRERRKAVVRALNATLAASGSSRRYTHLSNRARGLPSPVQGKLGQAATWLQRRVQCDEDRIARLASMKAALGRIKIGMVAGLQVDRLGATTAEGLGQERQHISDARMQIRSRMSRVIQAVCLRLGDVQQTVQALPHLDARLDRVGAAIAAAGQRRAVLQEKGAGIRIALARDPLAGLRENARLALGDWAKDIAATGRDRDHLIATLRATVSKRLTTVPTAIDPGVLARLARIGKIADMGVRRERVATTITRLPDLAGLRRAVRDRLAQQKARISGAIAPIDDRLAAIVKHVDAIRAAQADKLTGAIARSGTAARLAALLPSTPVRRGNGGQAVEIVPPAAARSTSESDFIPKLREAAFAKLAAIEGGVTFEDRRYRFAQHVLSDDELGAINHPDFVQETLLVLRRIWLEQTERRQKKDLRAEEPDQIEHDQLAGFDEDGPPITRPGGWER